MNNNIADLHIQPLRESLRHHPGMYLGCDLDKQGLHVLVREVLKSVVMPDAMNQCTILRVIVRLDDSLLIN